MSIEGCGNDSPPTDAVVSISNAIAWMTELEKERPLDLAARLAEAEPAVVGTAVRLADETKMRLMHLGVHEKVAVVAAYRVLLSGCIAMEQMRRGHAQLWADVWDAESTKNGGRNGS